MKKIVSIVLVAMMAFDLIVISNAYAGSHGNWFRKTRYGNWLK